MRATMRARFSVLSVAAAVVGLGAAATGAEGRSSAWTCSIEPFTYEVIGSEVRTDPGGEMSGLRFEARGTTTLSGPDCSGAGETVTVRESQSFTIKTRFDPYKNIVGRYEGVLQQAAVAASPSPGGESSTWDGRVRGRVEDASESGWIVRFDVAANGANGAKLLLQQIAVVERDAASPLVRLSATSGEIVDRIPAGPPA